VLNYSKFNIDIIVTIQGISNKENIAYSRKVSKKTLSKKFELENEEDGVSEEEGAGLENINLLSKINPFLVLNEINEEEIERDILKEKGSRLLRSLDDIRISLLDGSLEYDYVLNLKNNIEGSRDNFQNPKLKSVLDDIHLRAEVELAKLKTHLNADFKDI
jgi:hypothetical protein